MISPQSARNLGFIFDSDMSFSDQINSISKSCHFHIRDIRWIRQSSSSLYSHSSCNSLYSGISLTNKSQQTSTHSKFIGTCQYKPLTNTQKTTLASYQTKNRLQNLSSHIGTKHLQINNLHNNLYNSLSFPSHSVSTRSSDSLVLSIPYVRSLLGKKAFSVISPQLWNSLPPYTRNSSSLPIFRSRLKTCTPLQNCIPSL